MACYAAGAQVAAVEEWGLDTLTSVACQACLKSCHRVLFEQSHQLMSEVDRVGWSELWAGGCHFHLDSCVRYSLLHSATYISNEQYEERGNFAAMKAQL